jgi:hypothetical protein
MADADRRQRALARRARTVLHKARLGDVEHDLSPLCGEEAVSLVKRLTDESWALAGPVQPSYTRDRIPCRFVPGRLT